MCGCNDKCSELLLSAGQQVPSVHILPTGLHSRDPRCQSRSQQRQSLALKGVLGLAFPVWGFQLLELCKLSWRFLNDRLFQAEHCWADAGVYMEFDCLNGENNLQPLPLQGPTGGRLY